MRSWRGLALVILLLLPAQRVMSEIYTWTDKDGNLMYGDSPPAQGASKATLAPIQKQSQRFEPERSPRPSDTDANSLKRPRRSNLAAERFQQRLEAAEAKKQHALAMKDGIEAHMKSSLGSHAESRLSNLTSTFSTPSLDYSCRISACSSQFHKDFLRNFINNSKKSTGSFADLVVSLTHNEKQQYLVVGHESGNIDIWDTRHSQSKRQIKAHDYRANLISFTADGNSFFSNSYFEESTKLWSAATGELLFTIPKTRGPVCATPDSNLYLIATSESSEVQFFDLARKTLLPEAYLISGVVHTMAMDKASEQIAIGTASGTIEVWKFLRAGHKSSLQNTAEAKPYATGNWVVGLQFSSDGKHLYSVAQSGVIDEWDSATLTKHRSFPATIHVHSATFLKNNSLVALAGAVDNQGKLLGFVELVSLSTGPTAKYQANYNFPVIEYLPSLSSLIIAEYQSTQVRPLRE